MSQIVFFDGVCLLCDGFVDFLLKRDLERHFRFAPLQGENAKALLPPALREKPQSVVLWSQGQTLTQSDAVLTILGQLGGVWSLAKLGWIVPRFLRNFVYRFVSVNRYRWFGRRDQCRLPEPEERARYLD